MRKVALDLQPTLDEHMSGIGTYTYEICRRLKSNNDIEYFGNAFSFKKENRIKADERLKAFPYKKDIAEFPYKVFKYSSFILPLNYSNFFKEKTDLSIFFNYAVPGNVNGKVINVVHDLTYLRFPETVNYKNLIRLKYGMPTYLKRSDLILTVSEFSKKEIMELLHIPEEKIKVVYNAASFSNDLDDIGEVKYKYHINKDYLLFVGNIEPRKNIKRMIAAYIELREKYNVDIQLVLAGGKGWNNEEIFDYVSKSKYKNDIIFTGYVSKGEKNSLYKNAKAFIFPSIYEGFGIPPLEAMHFGCPCVVSRAASLPEVVGKAAKLVNPYSTIDIADGIYSVISNESYRQELINEGYIQEKKFSWDQSAKKLEGIIKDLLNIN